MMKRKTFGVPYMGSKNKLAKDIIEQLPTGKRFVDLFAGGCAMTHAAALSDKWNRILCNDRFPDFGQSVFKSACEGVYDSPEFERTIGYNEYFKIRDTDPVVELIWGFHTTHRYVSKKLDIMIDQTGARTVKELSVLGKPKTGRNPYNIPLERLNRIRKLSVTDLSNVEFTQIDYSDYKHEDGDVVYCDPPYSGTAGYISTQNFDNDRFWDWVRTRDYPVYVKEYNAPDDFTSIWSRILHHRRVQKGGIKTVVEHLFINSKWTRL